MAISIRGKKRINQIYREQAYVARVLSPVNKNESYVVYTDPQKGFVCVDRRDHKKVITYDKSRRKCEEKARHALLHRFTKCAADKYIGKTGVFEASKRQTDYSNEDNERIDTQKTPWVIGKIIGVTVRHYGDRFAKSFEVEVEGFNVPKLFYGAPLGLATTKAGISKLTKNVHYMLMNLTKQRAAYEKLTQKLDEEIEQYKKRFAAKEI